MAVVGIFLGDYALCTSNVHEMTPSIHLKASMLQLLKHDPQTNQQCSRVLGCLIHAIVTNDYFDQYLIGVFRIGYQQEGSMHCKKVVLSSRGRSLFTSLCSWSFTIISCLKRGRLHHECSTGNQTGCLCCWFLMARLTLSLWPPGIDLLPNPTEK